MEEYKKYSQKYSRGTNNSSYNNSSVEYYKTIEKRTISSIGSTNNTRYKQYSSLANKNKISNQGNKYERRNSFSSNQINTNNSYSTGQKYSYSGTAREKNNYVYYVSGIGYVNQNEENKNNKKETRVKPAPRSRAIPVSKPTLIKIQSKKKVETNQKTVLDNYQYHETKDIRRENNKAVVSHKRLDEPISSVGNQRNSKRYSSHTEQPKTVNKSLIRPEYEIVEQKRPIKQIETNKFSYRTEKMYENNSNKYISYKQENQSSRNYNKTNENKRQNSYTIRDISEKRRNNYSINMGNNSVNYRRHYVQSNISGNLQQNKTKYEKKYETQSNRIYDQNYNNIQKHEIKVTSRDKKIKNYNNNTNYSKNDTNITKRKPYIPTSINNNTKINSRQQRYIVDRRQTDVQRNERINQRIRNINNISKTQQTVEVFEHKGNYYPLEAVKQIEQIYEINRGKNIPQQIEQIALYERERANQNIRGNVKIEMHQRSQNIPQQVQVIEVHDKMNIKENIPQFVQQIEVHDINNKLENIIKTEDNSQNNEEEHIEQNNYEQQEEEKQEQEQEINHEDENHEHEQEQEHGQEHEHEQEQEQEQEQEVYQENQEIQEIQENQQNQEKIELENKEIEEHEEKNIEMDQQNQENMEQNEIISNNENIPQSDEKEGDLQLEEKVANENQDDRMQIQQLEYDQYIPEENIQQYIPQENIITKEEIYQINRRQYSNNRFNNEQNYINNNTSYCPIHGIYHNPYNQNVIFNMYGHFHNNDRNRYNINAEIGEDGMVGDTNNYKFYESKNIKYEGGEVNSMTFHHPRRGNDTNSNLYVATKVIPIMTDTKIQEYNTNNVENNVMINTHFHRDHENCPIHGDNNIQEQ